MTDSMYSQEDIQEQSDSILTSVKKVLNIDKSINAFDLDVIMHINSAFSKLQQLGVGPEDGFAIVDDSTEWSDYISDVSLNMVKSYVYLEVRLLFDPPTASLLSSLERKLAELEWRLLIACDKPLERTDDSSGE